MQPLLTQRQAAELLCLSERTLERLRVSGGDRSLSDVEGASAIGTVTLKLGLPTELLVQHPNLSRTQNVIR
jgi:hypothetical protein